MSKSKRRGTNEESPMTLTEFGKAIGITRWGVHKAIKTGRIPAEAVGLDRGKQYIKLPSLAARWWAESTSIVGRRSDAVDFSNLPEDVLAARKLRDLKLAQVAQARADYFNRAQPRAGIVSKNVVLAALASACRDELDSWGDRGTKRRLSAAVRRIQEKVKKEMGVE